MFKVVIDLKFILDYPVLKILKTHSSVVDRVTVDIWNYTSTLRKIIWIKDRI